ncbi:MAG: HAMP domain-containing protein, partial [Gaiellaceae bacterium]
MSTKNAGDECVSVVPVGRPSGIFPRVFVVNAALHGTVAGLLLFSPIRISDPVTRTQAILIVAALIATLLVNGPLLRVALAPLKRMAQEMDEVDLLDPGNRLPVLSNDEVGRAIATFNRMLERLERERRESLRRAISAHEDERAAI